MSQINDISFFPEGASVALYGASVFAVDFVAYLRQMRPDIRIICFVDTFKRGTHCGYPVVSPQEAAAKCIETREVDTIIITSGAVPAISATLEQLGVATYVSVGSLLRKAASKPPGVHFATRISDIPGEMAWKAWGHASELERLKSIVERSRPGLIASYTIIPDADGALDDEDAANAQPEAPLLLIGSGQYEIFKTQGIPLPTPLVVLDDYDVVDKQAAIKAEIESQLDIWKGGYREGDPLDPMSESKYLQLGWVSSVHFTYRLCIKPFIGSDTKALEIGCGGGAWSKAIAGLSPKELCCVDVLSAEEARFWEYVGRRPGVRHIRVDDLFLNDLPDGHFDYFFSFGCFCHLSPQIIEEYLSHIVKKLADGANGFLMVADYEKYNRAWLNHQHSLTQLVPRALRNKAAGLCDLMPGNLLDMNEDMTPRPGRWFNMGTDRACQVLEDLGMVIIERDMEINVRDPLIHFMKP